MKRNTSYICLFFLCLATLTYSQNDMLPNWQYIQIDSTKQMWGDWDQPEWLRYFGLDAGDVDGDGNMDIVSGRYIYHNPGATMEGRWKRTVLDDNVDGILHMNIDDDSYADIIAMALPHIYWYEAVNLEGTQYRRKKIGEVPATSHVNSQGFEKAQLVAGGKSEFVIAGNGDVYAISIPEKNPDSTPWTVNMICKDTSDEGIGIGDIDGDGDLDIAVGRRPAEEGEPKLLVWFENPGHINGLWAETFVGKSEHPIDRIKVADLNGDTKADIVITEERYPGLEPDANVWWFQQQTKKDWKKNKVVTQFSTNNLDITDIDADGDTDLLTAEHKGKTLELQLWKNDGKGNFSKTVIDTGKENHLGTQWIDLDNDGDLDIIGAGWDQHKFMHVWRNDAIRTLKTGMIFKEYPWVPDMVTDAGKFLRVGGKLDYSTNVDHLPKKNHKNGHIPLSQKLNLSNAIGAEVIVERVQSHEDTKNLRIQFNDGRPIALPEPPLIRSPATDYMFHSNIKASVPITDLKVSGNVFRLTVDKEQSWGWPQNIVYGIVLRIYYDEQVRTFDLPHVVGVREGDSLGNIVSLSLDTSASASVNKVYYLGNYDDVNVQGDGRYRQWQYRYHRTKIDKAIGMATSAPFQMEWDTQWLPDQAKPMSITALAEDSAGYMHVLPILHNLSLTREHSIHLIKPKNQEPFWTTRNNEHSQQFRIPVGVNSTDTAKLYWNSWSPCYSEGIQINGTKQAKALDTPCYDAYWHEETVTDANTLVEGDNMLTTLKTPLHEGEMVHGMDVQWPGIMLKLKQEKSKTTALNITEAIYEDSAHYVVTTPMATYYLDKKGGGFSRIIDSYGNDWVSYKEKPWNEYPASAASSFRGIPNLVFQSDTDSGAGHPGHDKCSSQIISDRTIKVESISGNWAWEWTFYDSYVVLDVLKTEEGKPYWFLYEGTPGGSYKPAKTQYGTNVSGPHPDQPDFYKGTVDWGSFKWAYFVKEDTDVTLFMAQQNDDDHMDMMSYLGNTDVGVASENGMTVFGFGRGKNTTPLLMGKQKFVIGMVDYAVNTNAKHAKISKHIESISK